MPKFDYKTEVLTSMVGHDKLRVEDLDRKLKQYGEDGWELVSVALNADLKGCGTVTCSSSSASAHPDVPHFQLVKTDGTVLGTRELGRPDWPPGSVIYTGPDEPNLRVVRILERDDECGEGPEWFMVLVVEEV